MSKLIWAFARMNPPTVGHRMLVDKVLELADGGPHLITLSGSEGDPKNPLPASQKIDFARHIAGRASYDIAAKGESLVHHLGLLFRRGVTDLTMVCGSDRVNEYKDLIAKYNGVGVANPLMHFKFDRVDVVSCGERDADNSISASKVREAVKNMDYKAFLALYPNTEAVITYDLYGALRWYLPINRTSKSRVDTHETGRKEEEREAQG